MMNGAKCMELNIEAQKQEFLTICRASIQREGLEDLLTWLGKADFYTAPASTKYHGAMRAACASMPSTFTGTRSG